MTTPAVRVFDMNGIAWGRDVRFPAIESKVLEGKATHPAQAQGVSVAVVRLVPGGEIQTHQHPIETETALVLAGQALFTHFDQHVPLATGMGVTIPPTTPHSIRNSGDAVLELLAIHTPPTR